jgi:hypothetical protein
MEDAIVFVEAQVNQTIVAGVPDRLMKRDLPGKLDSRRSVARPPRYRGVQ